MSSGSTYYHLSPVAYRPGSVLQAGNFGRILKQYRSEHCNTMLFREYILETIRLRDFPDKPSRLSCVFVFETIDEALRFRCDNQAFKNHVLLELEPVDSKPQIHLGCYVLPNQSPAWGGFEALAVDYWSTPPMDRIEVLIQCDMRVVATILI